jgi:hypothetical protein
MAGFRMSTDWWAVLLALLTATFVRLGALPHIPW